MFFTKKKKAQQLAVNTVSPVEAILQGMRNTVALPQGYFAQFTLDDYNVVAPFRYGELSPEVQSPLHRCTNVVHSSTPEYIRKALHNNAEHTQILLHVFQWVSPGDLYHGAELLAGHGYWRPMADLLQYVWKHRLYWAESELKVVDGKLKRVYSLDRVLM